MNFLNHPLVGTPYGTALDLTIVLAVVCYVLTWLTGKNSWVDRIWQICPAIFCWLVAFETDFVNGRVNLMTVLVTLWSVRLTYNLAIKGGFGKGFEDHRWIDIRERLGDVRFHFANVFFVAFQMALIWLFTAPIHLAWQQAESALTWIDALLAALFLMFLIGESVADSQQFSFQREKKNRIESGVEVGKPLLDSGLFSLCRHPNYLCDLAQFWVLYGFAIVASGQWLHWTGIGALGLNFLFLKTARMTEILSLRKYPTYADYQEQVPRLLPFTRVGCIQQS